MGQAFLNKQCMHIKVAETLHLLIELLKILLISRISQLQYDNTVCQRSLDPSLKWVKTIDYYDNSR